MWVRFFATGCLILIVGISFADEAAKPQTDRKASSKIELNSNAGKMEIVWHQLHSLPGTPGLATPFSGMCGETLIVAGGANFPDAPPWKNGTKVWHDTVYGLIDRQWKIIGRLPAVSAYGVSFQTDDGFICAGGSDVTSHTSRVFRLRWKEGQLVIDELPELPQPIANACGAIVGSSLFLAGGTENLAATKALSKLYSLNLNSTPLVWEERPDIPGEGRMLSVAAATADAFFVFSGAELSAGPDGKPVRRYLNDAWCFDVKRSRWRQLADLPNPVVAAPSPAPVVGDRRIVILGGDDGANAGFQPLEEHPGFTQHALVYSVVSDAWDMLPDLKVSRVTVPVVKAADHFILTSGELRPGVRSPEIWEMEIR